MMWLRFQLAAEEIERRLGLSWDAAQKTLLDACNNYQVRWKQDQGGMEIWDTDFVGWLRAKQGLPARFKAIGPSEKSERIIIHLVKMFPQGVPDRARYTRKLLKAKLIMLDPGLFPLYRETLRKAVAKYNASKQAVVVPMRRER